MPHVVTRVVQGDHDLFFAAYVEVKHHIPYIWAIYLTNMFNVNITR